MFIPERGKMAISDLLCLSEQWAAADVYVPADSHAPLRASPLTSGLRAPNGHICLREWRGVCFRGSATETFS